MSLRRTAFAAVIAMSLGLTIIVVLQNGFSTIGMLRFVEVIGVLIVAAAALLGAMAIVGVRMAGWKEPESEAEFERVVLRAERLAREGTAAEPTEGEFMELDPYDDADFEELVRDAMDDLPDLLRAALDRNVAVVISDKGRRLRGLRALQRRRRDARRIPGQDPDLPRHAAAGLRARRGPAAPPGDDHRAA